MGSKRGLLLLVAMLALVLQQYKHQQVSATLLGTVHVDIINLLQNAMNGLTVHCKSGDDDLGFQQLSYNDTYEFKFKNNWKDTTLFYCCFQWESLGAYVSAGTFDIYVAKRDQERCLHRCPWIVLESGLYSQSKKTDIWENLFTWPPNTTTPVLC